MGDLKKLSLPYNILGFIFGVPYLRKPPCRAAGSGFRTGI